MREEFKKGEIIIYKGKKSVIDVRLKDETVWLTQTQMANLFDTTKQNISLHVKNIFREGELKKQSVVKEFLTTAMDGKQYVTLYYNLDVIISVGYRIKSQQGVAFRIWATKVLREHIIKGYTVNQKRLAEKGLQDFERTLILLRQVIANKELAGDEARGLLRVIADYSNTWILLQKYDKGQLEISGVRKRVSYVLTYEEARTAINELKCNLIVIKEAGDLFGMERENLAGIIGNINQSFGGNALYPSVEEKAAHLLYFIIKDHPFGDGNKRIASLLFIMFLARNNYLFTRKGERKINNNALVALALLVAESKSSQKEVMIKLIVNLLK